MNKLILLVILSVAMVSQVFSRCNEHRRRDDCMRERDCEWSNESRMCRMRSPRS
jgi:hypothetical protein